MAKMHGGGGRYYERLKKSRRGGSNTAATVKITVFTALILLACVLRFAEYPALTALRHSVAQVLRTDSDYAGAVEVLGRAFTGQTEAEENVIAVFGRKILGLEGDKVTEPEEQATDPLEQITPPEDESPLKGEDGEVPDEGAEPEAKAGDFSGLAFASLEYSCEATFPVFAASYNLSAGLDHDELDDTTPDEPFEIPSPDSVDDTVYDIAFEYTAPATGRVSSAFGYRVISSSGDTVFHHGVDVAVNTGTKVGAFAAGTVSQTGYNSVYGNFVRIDHADGFSSMYAHLSKSVVKKGKKVKLGEKIGDSGSSGNVTGPHLHFELRKDGNIINPQDYLDFD